MKIAFYFQVESLYIGKLKKYELYKLNLFSLQKEYRVILNFHIGNHVGHGSVRPRTCMYNAVEWNTYFMTFNVNRTNDSALIAW